ncbi:DNA polymerase II [Pseudoalteromonas luteoviolacea B = ATCC 29581]|nr:DNA polymerase II [Pseudoalteromonas luteoviolacea B = ATCC 29581]
MAQDVFAGFILSRQLITLNGKTHIVFWLHSEQGPIKAVTPPQFVQFFIKQSQLSQAQSLMSSHNIGCDFALVEAKHFDGEPVVRCQFQHHHHFYQARKVLSEFLSLYEDDIRPIDRFLMERFIKGGVWVTGQGNTQDGYLEISNAKLKANPLFQPTLNIVSIDIECSGDGVLYSVGLVSRDNHRIIMIGEPRINNTNINIDWVPDEIALFGRLQALINHFDPDVFIGWNVIEFDFRVLWQRAQALGLDLLFGRNSEKLYVQEGQVTKLTLPGRAVLDGIDTLKNATYQFENFKLDTVASIVLGKNKTISNDDRLSEITRLFNEDKLSLASYNLKDCQLVAEIFQKLSLLEFAIKRTQLTGLELEKKGGSVAAFMNLYLPLLHRSGFVAPKMADHGIAFDSPGGYVMESKPGLYQNIIVLDYKSLYPSIIRTFLIDPLGLITGLTDKVSDLPVGGFNGAKFSRSHHHLPLLVSELHEARENAKRQNDKQLSQAIKIIMNSLYGVLGSKGCCFYDPRLASSITLRGHQIMLQTKTWLETEGFEVIYGDTDSTFVKLSEHLSTVQCAEVGQRLANLVNQKWKALLQCDYQLESFLELEFEVHYSQFFMPTIRHAQTGSKKRYVGLAEKGDKKELIFKGMETVRSDWTKLAQNFQYELFVELFGSRQLNRIFIDYVARLTKGEFDDQLVYKKRMQQALDKYVKNIPPHIRALKEAIAKEQHAIPNPGFVVEYVQTEAGPSLLNASKSINYNYYIDRQLTPIFEMVSQFDVSVESIHAQQEFPLNDY